MSYNFSSLLTEHLVRCLLLLSLQHKINEDMPLVDLIARLMFGESIRSMASFPNTIPGFGYTFNSDGELKKIDPNTGEATSEGYQFVVKKNDQRYNQKHYEALGELMTDYVYRLLEEEDLKKLPVPADPRSGEPQTFVYASAGAMNNAERPLLLLVHGSGVVRAGQWARSLIINDRLSTGTQIPYIKKAKELGYEVMVLNTNDNYRVINKENVSIRESDSAEAHFFYVWDTYVMESKAKQIAIVAHSYGGQVVSYLSWERLREFKEHVFAAALTDSVHYPGPDQTKEQEEGRAKLCDVGRNWRASDLPLDTPLKHRALDVPCVSAGHSKHEMTSASAMNSVFQFLEEKRRNLTAPKDDALAVGEEQKMNSTLEEQKATTSGGDVQPDSMENNEIHNEL